MPDAVVVGDDAVAVLADRNFDLTPHLAFTAALEKRLRLDLSTTIAVMQRLPLWASGDVHETLRREVAAFLAEDKQNKCDRAAQRIRSVIHSGLDGSDIDLLDIIKNVVHIFMEEVTGLPSIKGCLSDMPSILSSNLGVQSRRRLEASLRTQMTFARERFPDEPEGRHLLRVGQWSMGRDAMIGMLGLSLHHHLHLLDGRPLKTLRLPDVPTHTGVPAIGRIARNDMSIAGCPLSPGALIECRLDSLSGLPNVMRRHFFGAGAHLCLGRPLAMSFMVIVTEILAECDFGLKTQTFCLAEHDVFDIPAAFTAFKTIESLTEVCL